MFYKLIQVLPKPLTPLSYDVVMEPLERGVTALLENNGDGYDKSVVITHNRCCMASYNVSGEISKVY